ncbi:MAG: hydroxymethylbilane synthase [Planctomycetota bacterium]
MEMPRIIRVGTRASALARTQTGLMVDRLRQLGHTVEVELIKTQGDRRTDLKIAQIGSDGVFVRELERALLDNRIDAAVHSLKDLPTAETPGLALACVPLRGMPFDVLVARTPTTLETLCVGAIVGTSSIRRVAQVKLLRPDLVVRGIRGNVDTRLRHLDAGDYDCLILAGAGLERLGLSRRITQILKPEAFWPAVGQGALVIQIRADDAAMHRALEPLDDPATHRAVTAERSCLQALAGGCLAPIGAWARDNEAGILQLGACVLEDCGEEIKKITMQKDAGGEGGSEPVQLGLRVAESLILQGANEMLTRMRDGVSS